MIPIHKNQRPPEADTNITFPSDIVPEDDDAKAVWMQQFADAIVNFGQWCFDGNDQINFDAARANVNPNDFQHITNLVVAPVKNPNGTVSLQRSLPARLRPINALAHMINKAVGRVEGEGFDFTAHVVNEDAISNKLEDLSAELMRKMTQYIRQQSGVTEILGRPLKEGDDVAPVIPKEVEEMSLSTFQQENEIEVTKGLNYLMSKKNLFLKYKLTEQGLRNYLITRKMAFDTFVEYDPTFESIDPRFLIYELDSNSPFIHHGRYAGYQYTATPQELIDRCPELTDEQVKYIETQFKTLQANGQLRSPSPYWGWDTQLKTFYFSPYKLYWKALKRVKVKVSPNRFDEDNPHIHFIGPDEKIRAGEKVETRYVNTLFECTKIGSMYYQCREIPGQHQPQDEPAYRELPLIGIIDPNPSPIDLTRHLQDIYIECWYTIERLLGQAKGKVLVIDEAMEEDGPQQLYNMLAFGVYKYNSAKEGDQNRQLNPPVERDMGLSQAVTDVMRLASYVIETINMVTGNNDASTGIVKSDQTAVATSNAVQQQQLTMTPYYTVYYTVVEMVMQALCNLMRPAWAGKKKTAWFMGDNGSEFLNLEPGKKWDLDDYGVSVINSVGASQAKQLMIQMGTQMASTVNDPDLALGIMKMFRAKTDDEAERVFKQGIESMKKIQAEQRQMQQQQFEVQQKTLQQQAQFKQSIDEKKADAPVNVQTLKNAGDIEKLKLKQEHDADKQTVDYKNQILLKAAEILMAKESAKLEPEKQMAEA